MNLLISHTLRLVPCPARSKILFCAALLCLGNRLPAQDRPVDTVQIQIDPNTTLSRISDDFMGFGYETSAVAQTNFFSPKNVAMVRLYRKLSPHGLIRIGGIISDHTQYVPEGAPVVHDLTGVTVVNRASLDDLGDFARATGWKVMWGLNLGTGSKEEAVREALAVHAALGSSLQSLQIGNEVEDLRRFGKSYAAYHAAYLDYRAAIDAAWPDAPFSGPDSVGNFNWITNFAATEARYIKLLTVHYYRGGAGDPRSTLDRLLQPDDHLENRLQGMRELCREHNVAFRINEVNSFSGGGKTGVSDTFGSALWCLDFMFKLASYESEGVNMETDINQLGFISHYSPIVHDETGHCGVKPEYYGMLAFAMAGKGELLGLRLEKTNVNLTAYATRDSAGSIWVTVVNKDVARDAVVAIALPKGRSSAGVLWLAAPALESKDHVTLGGAEVSADGKWTGKPAEKVPVADGTAHLVVPHASAALLQLRR